MSDTLTNGIRIQVTTNYVMNQSNPSNNRFVFSYHVIISNEGSEESTLISRHWVITNSFGQIGEGRGIGVVGKIPTIFPGEPFRIYQFLSFRHRRGNHGRNIPNATKRCYSV